MKLCFLKKICIFFIFFSFKRTHLCQRGGISPNGLGENIWRWRATWQPPCGKFTSHCILAQKFLEHELQPIYKKFKSGGTCHKRLEFFSNTTTILVKLRNLSNDEHWNFTLTHVLGSSSPCNPQDIKIVRGMWLKI